MLYVYPDYYKEFKCIAGACRHSCCIGWEIDIDPDTAEFYRTVDGDFGEKLKRCIAEEETPHFILTEGERCPFLNEHNLCDVILTLGEQHICEICTEHPRFRCELPGRVEVGIGLCCEAAAELILGKKTPVKFEITGEYECDDEIIQLRDEVVAVLQDRRYSVLERADKMLELCGITLPDMSIDEWAEELISLERLDESWTEVLEKLKNNSEKIDYSAFSEYMTDRQTEYEQLLVYLIYRHFAKAYDMEDAAVRASFAVLGYKIVFSIGAAIWQEKGKFDSSDQTEIARLFSSEIEYSEDNLEAVFDLLTQY